MVTIDVAGKNIGMELDTGAVVSVASECLFREHLTCFALYTTQLQLRDYQGGSYRLKSQCDRYQSEVVELPLVFVSGDIPALLGRNWMEMMKLDWSSIRAVTLTTGIASVDEIVKRHLLIFKEGYRSSRDFKAKIYIRPETTPVFRKARPVPFARREMVAAELDRLKASDIITKVERSDCAAPTLNVVKTDKSIRVCGDYKVTVNPHVMVDKYPLPTAEDIFATLAGGKKFTKLNLTHAYNQLELDEESTKMLTINTHKGLYQPNRLSYGVNSAPAIFQRTMDQISPEYMAWHATWTTSWLRWGQQSSICSVLTKYWADYNGTAAGWNSPNASSCMVRLSISVTW